ncbi:MAG: N-acetylglucosamine-6-phosphate deacetylase [Chloroflexota bacterium]
MLICEADIYTPDSIIRGGTVRVEGTRIADVDAVPTADEERIEGRGLLLVPGLIDLQCNGLRGYDVLDGSAAALAGLAAVLPTYGCTAVLPTLVSSPPEVLLQGVSAIARCVASPPPGAVILGTHQEGPWLSAAFHGAHLPANLRPFDLAEWSAIRAAARETVRMVTLAPEVPGNQGAVAAIVAAGAIASLGHSGASYDEAQGAVAAGARMATHLFNAMTPFLHRAPGLPGAALDLPELVPGIIPDGHHIHPAAIRLAARARGPHGLVIVTDSVPVGGLPPGHYDWQGRQVHWDGETVRLLGGPLAGSGLTPIGALRRYVHFTGLDLHQALPAMTSTPARLLGLEGERGSIVRGARADLVLLTPDLKVRATLVGGVVAYRA